MDTHYAVQSSTDIQNVEWLLQLHVATHVESFNTYCVSVEGVSRPRSRGKGRGDTRVLNRDIYTYMYICIYITVSDIYTHVYTLE